MYATVMPVVRCKGPVTKTTSRLVTVKRLARKPCCRPLSDLWRCRYCIALFQFTVLWAITVAPFLLYSSILASLVIAPANFGRKVGYFYIWFLDRFSATTSTTANFTLTGIIKWPKVFGEAKVRSSRKKEMATWVFPCGFSYCFSVVGAMLYLFVVIS